MPRPKKTPEEIAAMQERILEAASELFFEEGFDGMSIRKIANRLGVSHMVIYTYFENREALMLAFRDRMMARMTSRHQEQMKRVEAGETLTVLRERLSQPQQTARERPGLFAIAWTRPFPTEHHHQTDAKMHYMMDGLAEMIRCGIAQGVCRDRDPELAAATAVSIILGPQILYANGRFADPELRDALSEESLNLAMTYLTNQQ